jgi:phenylalanyl-tRNA synthetase beta chain
VLRPSLVPGLLDAVVHNRHRETADVRLFETGAAFGPGGERPAVAWVMTGARDEHWSVRPGAIDFYDAKGIGELVAQTFDVQVESVAIDDVPWLRPGRAAALVAGGARLGVVGELRDDIVAARGLGRQDRVVAGEIDLQALAAAAPSQPPAIEPLPRYPSIVRDLSIVVADGLPAADLRGTIRAHAARTLVDVREFDRYRGTGIPDGHVSLSFRLTFRDPERTLTDAEVQQAVDAVVAALERTHGARLRGA